MKAIGFKNFRKFIDFPERDFAPITMLVGGNNSGKSTTVKAIVSVFTFLRNARLESKGNINNQILYNNFYFNQNPYVHIGTFKRAKCNKTESNDLFFQTTIEDLNFYLWLNGDGADDNTTYAHLTRFKIEDTENRSSFDYDFDTNNVTVSFETNVDLFESKPEYIDLLKKITEYETKVTNGDHHADRNLDRYKRQLRDKYPVVKSPFTLIAKITDVALHRMIGGPFISGLIYNTCYYFMDKEESLDNTNQSYESSRISDVQNYIFSLSHRLETLFYMYPLIEYIYAHAASQIVLYNSIDNNYLSRTIHEFANFRKDKDLQAFGFVEQWMKFFEIGKSFELKSIGGEAHTFDIHGFDDKLTPLADKGMGTIQLIILLLRIAIIINDRSVNGKMRKVPTTIIIEEPEQNLHPKKQSQLIEFFKQIYDDYGIRFIIETHSEYLIRRSQVMVAESKYKSDEQLKKECPFKVYYYPENGLPYDMEYQTNGRFARDFESGFFDEASKSALLLSKIERGRV